MYDDRKNDKNTVRVLIVCRVMYHWRITLKAQIVKGKS